MNERSIVEVAVGQLQAKLAEVPFCTLEQATNLTPPPPIELDWAGKLRTADGERLLLLDAKMSGQPRLARDAVNALQRLAGLYPNAVCVFAAPYISADTGKILERENVGYVDLSGNCRLTFDRVYIRIEGRPNQSARRREIRSLFSPKAERVLRTLLLEPRRGWKIKELAATAQVSLGQASNVKKLLDDREWLCRRDGIRLAEPARLLKEWSESYDFRKSKACDYYSMASPAETEARIANACTELGIGYALAGFSAAARLAPSVRYQRVTAYVADRIDEVAERVGLKPVTSGPNVALLQPYDEGVMAGCREVDGIRITSAIQTYLDLQGFRGRGEEAAKDVFKEAIEPQW